MEWPANAKSHFLGKEGEDMGRLTSYDENRGLLVNEEERLLSAKGFIDKDEMYKIMRHLAEKLCKYEDLEDQGLLLKLPCKVGDTVYFISEKVEKQGRKKAVTEFVGKGIVDNITLGNTMLPQITVCNDENIWTTFDSVDDFGKIVFLTQAEAEEALKGMEEENEAD